MNTFVRSCLKMFKLGFLLSFLIVCCTAAPSNDFWMKWRTALNDDQNFQLHDADKTGVPKNVITVPTNCGPNQQWVNGACRDIWRRSEVTPVNVVTVPPNCPNGQEYVNGQCRDIWNRETDAAGVPKNVITVPTNCRPNQQWINGACRDIWRRSEVIPVNVVTVPPNCPNDQEYVNGQCRDIWNRDADAAGVPKNVVTVPPNCGPNQQWINGACRDIWRQSEAIPVNVVTVPPNCPNGQEYVKYQCRDIWNRSSQLFGKLVNNVSDTTLNKLTEEDAAYATNGSSNRNIINVPNQCPAGFRPDALGICRPIFG